MKAQVSVDARDASLVSLAAIWWPSAIIADGITADWTTGCGSNAPCLVVSILLIFSITWLIGFS